MALPTLTAEQRSEALRQAARARARRAELKTALKTGSMRLSELLDLAETDEAVGKMKVAALLRSLPRIGATKAAEVMGEIGISESRRVRGLGAKQRAALIRRFG